LSFPYPPVSSNLELGRKRGREGGREGKGKEKKGREGKGRGEGRK
jgi:hypothetical protein